MINVYNSRSKVAGNNIQKLDDKYDFWNLNNRVRKKLKKSRDSETGETT